MKIYICSAVSEEEKSIQANSPRHARRRYRKKYIPHAHPTTHVDCYIGNRPILDLPMPKEKEKDQPKRKKDLAEELFDEISQLPVAGVFDDI